MISIYSRKFLATLVFASLSSALVGCGGSDSTTATTTTTTTDATTTETERTGYSTLIPEGTISSPTSARTATATASNRGKLDSLYAIFRAPMDFSLLAEVQAVEAADATDLEGEVISEEEASEATSDIVESGDEAAAVELVENILEVAKPTYPPCYGPGWQDDATGTPVNRPTGDLGITYETASDEDGTACVAAKLNALIAGPPQLANKLMLMQAILMDTASEADPDGELPEGESLDLTEAFPTITGATVTSATLENLDGDTYKSAFELEDADGNTGSATLYFTKLNEDGSDFSLLIQADFPYTATMGATGTHRGISMIQKKEEGIVTFVFESGANRTTDQAPVFTTAGRYDFTDVGFGEDGHKIIAETDETTGRQSMHYAWQAGGQDGASRALAVQVDADGETGRGYFGFGAAIDDLSDDLSTLWPTKMHCNWLNQLANGATVAKVQGQSFTLNADGIFEPETSSIAFAPTDTCQKTGSFTISNATSTFLNGTRTIETHALVDIGDLANATTAEDVDAVTVPEYTIPE